MLLQVLGSQVGAFLVQQQGGKEESSSPATSAAAWGPQLEHQSCYP